MHDGVSQLDRLKAILAAGVGVKEENLDIFSVLNVPDTDMVDIRYAAHGSSYYPAHQLDLAALSIKDAVQSQLLITVSVEFIFRSKTRPYISYLCFKDV